MSKYDIQLKTLHDDFQNEIADAIEKTNKASEDDLNQFQRNTMDNIAQQFGDFLYTALGDRVTGQRNSVLNKRLLESEKGQRLLETAKSNNQTIEEYLISDQKKYGYQAKWYNHNPVQIYITAGRKFGVSYFTGDGNRVHTIYFGAGQCFKYLTQEHVDCVRNKQKRKCAQDFLKFRDDFVDGIDSINSKLIHIPMNVKLGVASCITKTKKINQNGSYTDRSKNSYTIMDDYIDGKITHMMVNAPSISIWNGVNSVKSGNASVIES
jgi:hypothetical protein